MPTIGLLSDSHGRADITARAVAALVDAGARVLVHLGDVGSVQVLDALAVPDPRDADRILDAHVVFGNTDDDWPALANYARTLGITVDHPVGCLTLEPDATGRAGALTFLHGDDELAMREAMRSQPRYLCHGHTHQKRDQRIGPTRVINPGALTRASRYTVALLETTGDSLQFLSVD